MSQTIPEARTSLAGAREAREERESLALALIALQSRTEAPIRLVARAREDEYRVFELREAIGSAAGGRRFRVAVDPALGVAMVTPL